MPLDGRIPDPCHAIVQVKAIGVPPIYSAIPALSDLPENSLGNTLGRMMKKLDIESGIALSDIAKELSAQIVGSSNISIRGLSPLNCPERDCLSFSSEKIASRLLKILKNAPLAALIVDPSLDTSILPPHISYLPCPNPFRAFIDLVPLFYQHYETPSGVDSLASVHPSAVIGQNVSIAAFVSIGSGCVIGDDTVIHSHVTLYPDVTVGKQVAIHSGVVIRERCMIGDQVIIQSGTIIGSDGFGYIPDEKQGIRAVPQVGRVILENKVEVGANTCIDRGAFGDTIIGFNTKIDNQVQIGHNVSIGQFSIVCGQTGIAGSAKIGNQVTLGGAVRIGGHLSIPDKTRLAGNACTTSTLKEAGDYGGFPAQLIHDWHKQVAALKKLPQIIAKLRIKQTPDIDDRES